MRKTVPKEFIDEKGVLHIGATEDIWRLEVRALDGNLLKSETEVMNKALQEAIKANWKPDCIVQYVDNKGNIYLMKEDHSSLPSRQIPSLLRISPSGQLSYINIKIPNDLLKSKNYLSRLIIKYERMFLFLYLDPAKSDLSIKDRRNKSVRREYPLQRIQVFIFSLNGDFVDHYVADFKEKDFEKYGVDSDLFGSVEFDSNNKMYIKSFIKDSKWEHIECYLNVKNTKIEIDYQMESEVFELPIFALIHYKVWMYDPINKVWQMRAEVQEPEYGSSFFPHTNSWDVDAQGNLYYLKWTRDALEVWMVPASGTKK